MAKCVQSTVKKEVKKVELVSEYKLTLTKDEAEALVALVASVTGDPAHSPRKHTEAIFFALTGQGVSLRLRNQIEGTFRFLRKPSTTSLYGW